MFLSGGGRKGCKNQKYARKMRNNLRMSKKSSNFVRFFGWGSRINQKTKIIREADVGDWSKIIKN